MISTAFTSTRISIRFLTLLCCIASLAPASADASSPLPEPVLKALKRARIPPSHVGVVVQEVNSPTSLMALNAGEPMNPASTMKLLTTYSALDTLGPAWHWKTEAWMDGKLENGVLQGNLVFKGYGDPKLTLEQFWMWLRELRQRGLREVRGDIVLDHSYFADTAPQTDFDNEPTRAYNASTNALLLNFNAVRMRLSPHGSTATVLIEPDLAGYTVRNEVSTSSRLRCRAHKLKADVDGQVIRLYGKIPSNCGDVEEYFSLLPHDKYFHAVFTGLWKELGGSVQGGLRTGTVPASATLLSRYISPSLAEMIRDINKFSNNIMARQVFMTLGMAEPPHTHTPLPAEPVASDDSASDSADDPEIEASQDDAYSEAQVGGDSARLAEDMSGFVPAAPPGAQTPAPSGQTPQASVSRSINRVQDWLKAEHFQFPELVLENGSGLSRKERISPRHLAQLLQHIAHSPFYAELAASLPILGMDGTVRRRFNGSELAGYAHLKTGTLDDVKSLAGYVDTRDGKKWVVVFIINDRRAAKGQAAQDALIQWVRGQAH